MRSILFAFLLLAVAPAAAADFTVDVSVPLKPVDHAASGSLYGIAGPGWPPESFIDALHPKNFTQMAPGGHQLPNGETAPVGDALVVAPIAARAGASVTIRMPDTFPDFPYIWRGPEFWAAEVDRIVKATVAANPPNIYAYEIWNEPDWNWQPQWGDFNAMWATTFKSIRAGDPSRRIMGPSVSQWNADWMRRFLSSAKVSGTLPDVVSWHELDPAQADDIEAHVAAFRALEKELGLVPHPISINEYGSQRAMGNPGALVHYIAQLERAGVDTADLAFWHRPGRLSDLLVPKKMGTGPATDPLPNGAYWLYNWYGAMLGKMVSAQATPGSGLDGFAAYDEATRALVLVVGGKAGTHHVTIRGLTGFVGRNDGANVVETTSSTGTDGAVPEGRAYWGPSADIQNGTFAFDVTLGDDTEAVRSVLFDLQGGDVDPTSSDRLAIPQRTEAETGTITGGRKFSIRLAGNFGANHASGNAYAGLFNKAGASVTLPISAPILVAGTYDVTIGYSNGQAAAIPVSLSVAGGATQHLSLLPTQARELFGLAHAQVDLPVGDATLTLALAAPLAGPPAGPSLVEFDYVDLAPAASLAR
jgi:hypothetical protein